MFSLNSNIHFVAILFALFVFCAPMVAFAQDALNDGYENQGSVELQMVEPKAAEAGAFDHVNSNSQNDSAVQVNAQINAYGGVPIVAPETIENPYFVSRIFSDIGFTLLYDAALFGIGAGITYMTASKNDDEGIDSLGHSLGHVLMGLTYSSLASLLTPGFAIHTSHALLDGRGNVGLGYAGGVLGAIAGAALGAIAYASDDLSMSLIGAPILMASLGTVGGLVGGILWYEHSDREARKESYFNVQNVHPVIDITSERSVFGVGFQF